MALLPLARRLASLDATELDALEDPESTYQFGWSHGRESLDGKPDRMKASFYANPRSDDDPAGGGGSNNKELMKKYPTYTRQNLWPSKSLPELRPALCDLGDLICEVGKHVAREIDSYVGQHCPSYETGLLRRIVEEGKYHKARLLHYFPVDQGGKEEEEERERNWCAFHNDHSCLTGLVRSMYVGPDGEVVAEEPTGAGLVTMLGDGSLLHVKCPEDSMIFQIGETTQILSGGKVVATPHAVRAGKHNPPGVSREAFAVFMQPQWDEPMKVPDGCSEVQTAEAVRSLPPGLTPISSRFKSGQTFHDFSEATFGAFY